jgi:ubiquinone/menaquinone biosynthesis C-methylase UbiE
VVDRDTVREGYDALAETYDDQRTLDGRGTELLADFLDDRDPDRVLDAGCGAGRPVLERLDRHGATVGLDVSREQLALAREAVPGVPLLQGDLAHLPLGNGSVDAVVAYWSLIHVPLADHRQVLEEFARVLAAGGAALVCEGPGEWVGQNDGWLDTDVEMGWELAGVDRTRDQLRAAGFEVLGEYGVADSLDDDDEPDWVFVEARLDG